MPKIKNTKDKIKETINLNDEDILNSLLTSLKELSKNYAILLTELSNEHLYEKFKTDYLNIQNMQREIFELAFQNGFYELTSEEVSKINTKYKSLCTKILTLCNSK